MEAGVKRRRLLVPYPEAIAYEANAVLQNNCDHEAGCGTRSQYVMDHRLHFLDTLLKFEAKTHKGLQG